MSSAVPRAGSLVSRRRLAIFAGAVVSLLALYALLGFLVAPVLIERGIANFADRQLERTASVGKVRLNPFLFRLELEELNLAERDGAPILSVARLLADFDPSSSLARRAWTLSEVSIEKPDLHVDIGPDGKVNLALILEKWPRSERRPDEKMPRLLLQRASWRAGKITFTDRSGAKPVSTAINPADLELREISTLAGERGDYTVNARLVDGGAISWRGEILLDKLSSQGEIAVKGVKPATAWQFLQDSLAIAEPRGELDFGARYRFALDAGIPKLVIDDARVAGRGIEIAAAGAKEPILVLGSVEAAGGRLDLASREFSLASLELREGALVVDVDPQRTINWGKLLKTEPPPAPSDLKKDAPGPGAEGKEWKGKVESVRVAGMRLDYTDRSRKRPLHVQAKNLALALSAQLAAQGRAGAQVKLEGIALELVQLSGRDLGAQEPLLAFDTAAIEGGQLDLEQRQITLARIAVKGGAVKVVRNPDGAVDLIDRLQGSDAGLVRREVTGALKEAQAEGRPWRLAVDSLEVAGIRVPIVIQGHAEPVLYDGQDLRARMTGFRSDGDDPVTVEASVRIAQGGSVAASGVLRLSGDELTSRIKVDGFPLTPLQPLLVNRVRAVLASGELTADLKADYRVRGGKREIRASGSARIDNARLNDATSGERLISWKSFAANGVKLSLSPDDLKVDETRLTGLDTSVVIYKDRSVNLVKAIELESGASGSAPSAAAAPVVAEREAPFPVTVGRVLFEKSEVDFADLSLVLPFAAKVQDLEGTIQGVSSDRASRATVRMEGRVDEYGLARVNGSLRTFQPRSFLDLNVTFRNVDMPPLSPYSATFAGRRIASGRLALDLQYKINDGQLAGDNRVVLEKFTLGERVESPGALDLPLDLAVALLTDSDGRIDIAVPVRGDVNDPQFSYGHVIWQAITNLLTRIVTAPFRALASLFGGANAEQLGDIVFDPGRAALLPPEREKLKRVGEGLARRPQLGLVAEGQYGPADRAALQRQDIELAVASALGRASAPGQQPEPVAVSEAKTQRALEALFVERNSEQALAEFVAGVEKTRGKPVTRVNAALALIGRGSSDQAFYEALLQRLNETARVPDTALRELAAERARAVVEHLSTVLSVPAARAEALSAGAPGASQVKLTLNAARPTAAEKPGETR